MYLLYYDRLANVARFSILYLENSTIVCSILPWLLIQAK